MPCSRTKHDTVRAIPVFSADYPYPQPADINAKYPRSRAAPISSAFQHFPRRWERIKPQHPFQLVCKYSSCTALLFALHVCRQCCRRAGALYNRWTCPRLGRLDDMTFRLRWSVRGWSFPRKTRTPSFARFLRRGRLESAATSRCSPTSSTSGPRKDTAVRVEGSATTDSPRAVKTSVTCFSYYFRGPCISLIYFQMD